MNRSKVMNKIIIKIQQEIIETTPVSVAGMPHARVWVFEEVINRIGESDPLLCSVEKGYERISPWGAKAAIKGLYGPFPELEGITLAVVEKFLNEINEVCPTYQERKGLAAQMSQIV